MIRRMLVACFVLLLISGCSGNSNSASNDSSTSSEADSNGRLFGGKCADNQQWLASLEESITIPADWQSVYDLTQHSTFENFWGISSEGNTFDDTESVEWGVYTSRLSSAVAQGNYSEAIRMYDLLYPLMEKMDLQCAVAVTGEGVLSTTIVP